MSDLVVHGLSAGYQRTEVLHEVSLTVQTGDLVAVVGPNGAGKTTLAHCLMGVVRASRGSIHLDGVRVDRLAPECRAAQGIAIVPEGRRLFARLSVADNLDLALFGRRLASTQREARLESVYELFPILAGRRRQQAGSLSGGEQEMLAIARALLLRPRFLILDEPSTGLAPAVVSEIFAFLQRITRNGDCGCLLIEQQARTALRVASRACLLRRGRLEREVSGADLAEGFNADAYFGLS